jgi:cytidyltransferase-like protein
MTPPNVISAAFDDLRACDVRLIEEAFNRAGPIDVKLWSDVTIGHPKFPFAERKYLIESLRFVRSVVPTDRPSVILPAVRDEVLDKFPDPPPCPDDPKPPRKKVIVTGCFDWLHSGHVRFLEEVSELGDLYVIVGHDVNISLLKGHAPMFHQNIRRYMVSAVRFVKLALISTGRGWMDAEPQIARLKPDVYAVNEDGDRAEKRAYCAERGIEYRILKRDPKPGLPRRHSTSLRGF